MTEQHSGPVIICPTDFDLRDRDFTHTQARRVLALGLAPGTLPEFITNELYARFEGVLMKPGTRPGDPARRIDLALVAIENAFGEDAPRQMRRYVRFAAKRPCRRLDHRLVLMARWIYFALAAFEHRTGKTL